MPCVTPSGTISLASPCAGDRAITWSEVAEAAGVELRYDPPTEGSGYLHEAQREELRHAATMYNIKGCGRRLRYRVTFNRTVTETVVGYVDVPNDVRETYDTFEEMMDDYLGDVVEDDVEVHDEQVQLVEAEEVNQ